MKTGFIAIATLFALLLLTNCQKTETELDSFPDNSATSTFLSLNLDKDQMVKLQGEKTLLLIHKENHCIGAFSFSIDTNGIPFFERNSPVQEAFVVLDTLIEINSENATITIHKLFKGLSDSLNITLVNSKLEMFNQKAFLQNKTFQLDKIQFLNYSSIIITTSKNMIHGNELDGSTVKLFNIDFAKTEKQIDSLLDNYHRIKLRSELTLITESIETAYIQENDKQENLYIRQFPGVSFFPFVAADSKYLILFEKNETENILFKTNSAETKEMWKIVNTKNAMLYGFRLAERS